MYYETLCEGRKKKKIGEKRWGEKGERRMLGMHRQKGVDPTESEEGKVKGLTDYFLFSTYINDKV